MTNDAWSRVGAERHGHELVAEFTDSAISGANIRLLPGLQQALQSIYAREVSFEAIAVDQLSRLSRDIGDTDAIVKRLRFFGVRLVAVSDGLDTADETNKISVTVKSLVNEIFLDDLRKTTKRGLDGQFLKTYSTGGRTYGYRSEPVYSTAGTDPRGNPIPTGYRLTIVPSEAAVVQRVFRLFAEGHGEKAIAKALNAVSTATKLWRPNTIYPDAQESSIYRPLHLQSPWVAKESRDRQKSVSMAEPRSMGVNRDRRSSDC
jgi:site-specific DNA recombinase